MKKKWSGERLETEILSETTVEHLHRYAIARDLARNKVVLDIACGEGYGSNLIAKIALNVIGVDISVEAIREASLKYKEDNLRFAVGSADKIPCPDNFFDLVVSFETIEHHDRHIEMMKEIKRVLKPNGVVIISSPDKKFYSDIPNYKNPHHVKELYMEEFKLLMEQYFRNTKFYFQKSVTSSLVIPTELMEQTVDYAGTYEDVTRKNFQPLYNLCVASDDQLPVIAISTFDCREVHRLGAEKSMQLMRSSLSYRLGNFLLSPLKYLLGK